MLVLEVAAPEILAFYRPPGSGPNIGGHLGRVFPGGNFRGLSYAELLALGTGSHEVRVDERAKCEGGTAPAGSDYVEALGRLRWSLFMYRVGACTEGEVIGSALLAMTPENVARAADLLPPEWQRRLRDMAGEIPAARKRGGLQIFSNARVTPVPDENLVAVQHWFGGAAEPPSAPDTSRETC